MDGKNAGKDSSRLIIVAVSEPLLAGEAGKVAGGGTEIIVALTDDALLQAADRDLPRLVLMDASTRKDGGAALFSSLRTLQRPFALGILAITGPSGKEAEGALKAGADDFIRKPLGEEELALRLKGALKRLDAQEALMAEREYYKQAVHQEERLSFKLLDRTVSLRESLADLGQARESLRKAGAWTEGPRDPLTGLLSEEGLLDCLRSLTASARKGGESLSCILIGLEFSATAASKQRPEDLKSLGTLLESTLRKADKVGRFGRIGFLVLLPGSELDMALGIAQRIREGLRAFPPPGPGGSATAVCQGVSQYRLGEDAPEWMRRTGAALKRARELGKDAIASA